MSPVKDDFLDGCDIDFLEHADDVLTAALRPLFPAGDPSTERAWQEVFEHLVVEGVLPKAKKQRREAVRRGAFHRFSLGGYDVGIAARLRAKGLHVVEVDGWKTRGSGSFSPRGSVDHHTAGGAVGAVPSLGICINGRSDLSGPLCNVLIGRDNACYVVAAGRANHAGQGGWRGLSGNSSVYGVERENVGTAAEPWRNDQTDTAARCHAALIEGRATADMVCEHFEWTPRKIDAHDIRGNDMRWFVSHYLGTTHPDPQKEEDMPPKPISSSANPGYQHGVVGDNLIPIDSTKELGLFVASGLLSPGGPVVWDAPLFDKLVSRLNVQDK